MNKALCIFQLWPCNQCSPTWKGFFVPIFHFDVHLCPYFALLLIGLTFFIFISSAFHFCLYICVRKQEQNPRKPQWIAWSNSLSECSSDLGNLNWLDSVWFCLLFSKPLCCNTSDLFYPVIFGHSLSPQHHCASATHFLISFTTVISFVIISASWTPGLTLEMTYHLVKYWVIITI